MASRKGLVALDILFVNTNHLGGKIVEAATHGWHHVAFWNVQKPARNKKGKIAEMVAPEGGLFPLNKYDEIPASEKEIVRLWVTPEERAKVEAYIAKTFGTKPPKYGHGDCIFSGIYAFTGLALPDLDRDSMMCSYFVTEGLRLIRPGLLAEIPANCVNPQQLYTGVCVLAAEGGSV